MASDPPVTVFDISSDEEPALEEPKACDDDDHNWLTQLLETVDKVTDGRLDCDDDEVVVVGEYNTLPKSKSKSNSWKQVKDVEDDDCVVLDGDPDNPVAVANDSAEANEDDGCGDDDVLVVGQKGQIACRDYPHPRHLCVNLSFDSTPHERHCQLCHCYVCDSIAPCAQWGTGMSLIDHCHATDKLEMWKTQREIFKIGKDSPLSVSKVACTPLPVTVPQVNQAAPRDISQSGPYALPQIQVGLPESQVCRPAIIRSCSSSSRLRTPNQPLGCVQGRREFLPRIESQHALGVRNSGIRRDRSRHILNLGQQFCSSSIYKRPGNMRGALPRNQSLLSSLENANCPSVGKYTRHAAPLAVSTESPAGPQDFLPNVIVGSCFSSLPNVGIDVVNTGRSRSELYGQSISPPNNSENVNQLGNQGQNLTGSGLSDLDFNWVNNLGQGDQQASVENIQLHYTGSNYEASTVKQFNSQFAGAESPQFNYNDQEYESWLPGSAIPGASEACAPHDLNVISPEPPVIDAGMIYFDFETSLNGLMHA